MDTIHVHLNKLQHLIEKDLAYKDPALYVQLRLQILDLHKDIANMEERNIRKISILIISIIVLIFMMAILSIYFLHLY